MLPKKLSTISKNLPNHHVNMMIFVLRVDYFYSNKEHFTDVYRIEWNLP